MTAPLPDGDLRGARIRLATAIQALTGRTTTTLVIEHDDGGVEHRPHWGDSLYVQLVQAIPGAQGTQLGATARSMPPLWVDASDTIADIDRTVTSWQPDPGPFDGDLSAQRPPTPETVRRLRLLEDRPWRPQDSYQVERMATTVAKWAADIEALLNPAPKWTLPNPCPACGAKVAYRPDSSGELVRQAALQIGPDGCECQRCHYVWGPGYYRHLARTLGYELPAGVLE